MIHRVRKEFSVSISWFRANKFTYTKCKMCMKMCKMLNITAVCEQPVWPCTVGLLCCLKKANNKVCASLLTVSFSPNNRKDESKEPIVEVRTEEEHTPNQEGGGPTEPNETTPLTEPEWVRNGSSSSVWGRSGLWTKFTFISNCLCNNFSSYCHTLLWLFNLISCYTSYKSKLKMHNSVTR